MSHHEGFETGRLTAEVLRELLSASAAINASIELEEVLRQIAEGAARVLRSQAAAVLLHDMARKRLVFRAAWGEKAQTLLGFEMADDLGIAGRVLHSGKAEIVRDAQLDPDHFGGVDERMNFVTGGLLAAPMSRDRRTVGVIEVLNPDDDRAYTQGDLDALRVFANLAAIAVSNAQRHEVLKRDNLSFREAVTVGYDIIGESPALRKVIALCDRVSPTDATVLVLGETGTGKELTARRIHAHSSRSDRAFVAINCAALPESLLESELFGHEAGAFTGAVGAKVGKFEQASGGTIFLDEIGDVSQSIQVKLLRVLQEREFVRVGGTQTLPCDVRVVAATNRDLQKAMDAGEFRQDLYYRLNVFPVHLPPLRERGDDVPRLIDFYIDKTARDLGWIAPRVAPEALERLRAYRWPGNIRELRNVVERCVLLCDSGEIALDTLPHEIAGAACPRAEEPTGIEGYEKSLILKTLEDHDWNQTRAAEVLGISRDNLRYRLRKYDISRPDE